jgi:hypothetical protein
MASHSKGLRNKESLRLSRQSPLRVLEAKGRRSGRIIPSEDLDGFWDRYFARKGATAMTVKAFSVSHTQTSIPFCGESERKLFCGCSFPISFKVEFTILALVGSLGPFGMAVRTRVSRPPAWPMPGLTID